MREDMRALIVRHCETLRSEAAVVTRAVASIERVGDEGRSAALGAAHKLKGSSGTLGFSELSGAAAHLEELLRNAGDGPLREDALLDIREAEDRLASLAAAIAPEGSALFAKLAGGAT